MAEIFLGVFFALIGTGMAFVAFVVGLSASTPEAELSWRDFWICAGICVAAFACSGLLFSGG